MTAIWMGVLPVREAISSGKVIFTGNRQLGEDMQVWLRTLAARLTAEKKMVSAQELQEP